MDSFIARQPIFNKRLSVYAYELLHRSCGASAAFNEANADRATTEVIMETFGQIGLNSLTGGKRAFINFSETFILNQYATLFPNDILVIEILESVPPTPEIIAACRALKEKGYILALDDFVFSEEYRPLIELANIIKLDVLAVPEKELPKTVAAVQGISPRCALLAEKVETEEVFEYAKTLGFSYFQGYFFSKPVVFSRKTLNPLKLNYFQMMRYVHQPQFDLLKLARVIRQDVALSYKLLRLINSAFFGFRHEVKNIQHALALLGEIECRKWISLVSMLGISSDKPDELIRITLLRGRFLELISAPAGFRQQSEDLFQLGLFSNIDVILDMSMRVIIPQLNLSKSVSSALLTGSGELYDLLSIIKNYEIAEWDAALSAASKFGLSDSVIADAYLDAVKWVGAIIF